MKIFFLNGRGLDGNDDVSLGGERVRFGHKLVLEVMLVSMGEDLVVAVKWH